MKHLFIFLTVVSHLSWASAPTQTKGVMDNPCQVQIPQGQMLNMDFGQLCKYEGANASLRPATDHRVVYLGDSITEFWGQGVLGLSQDDVVNRGISGQTTAQMLVRFRADVLNLHPRVLVMLAGTNDIAGNTGATSLTRIENNLASMAEQAQSHGIRVVMASVLPVKFYPWSKEVDSIKAISTLNQWIRQYAESHGIIYLDYFSSLVDNDHGCPLNLCYDGVHPTPAGYAIMAPLALDAIQRANALPGR